MLARLLRRRRRDPRAELRRMIGDYELRAFPSSVMKTLEMLRDPDCALASIAETIQLDPGINVRVLRMVNSAAFGLLRKVTNVHHGVTLLGRSRLESLVLSSMVSGALPAADICRGLDQARFWQSCARRACLARSLGRHLHPATDAESFTAGLLQDMAIAVLAAARPESYPALVERALAEPTWPLHAVERQALGYDHAELGALMVEAWGLPEALGASIADHHLDGPESRTEPAVRLAARLGYGQPDDGGDALRAAAVDGHGIEPARVEEILAGSARQAAQIAHLLH